MFKFVRTLAISKVKDYLLAALLVLIIFLILLLKHLADDRQRLKVASLNLKAKEASQWFALKRQDNLKKQPFILLGLAALEADGLSVPVTTSVSTNLAPPPAQAPSVTISSPGSTSISSKDGLSLILGANETAKVYYAQQSYYLVVGGQTKAITKTPILFTSQENQPLYLNDYTDLSWDKTVNLNAFAGAIEVVYSAKSKHLWAVNELPLETYLQGVTEAAADGAPEYLKTMAIVARSYAYYHLNNGGRHKGEPFHLKNSRNGNGDDQVYQGYLAAVRVPQIAEAAKQTKGQVVMYNGKPVITPYSAVAGGRTLSPQEAGWNYNWPWVKSVPDPDTAGLRRLGHGVGLSGLGAKKRAERGATAVQILQYYFPGTSLGKVNTDNLKIRVAIY